MSNNNRPIEAPRNAGVVDTTRSPYAKLRSVPVSAVTMGDGFWRPRMVANRQRAIPRLYTLLEEHGVLDNFRRLYGAADVPRRGPLFTDSDLFKWMEAAALVLQGQDAAQARDVRELLGRAIEVVLPAQGEDGYLNTYYVEERADQRFADLPRGHELYCAGHLFQAAVAAHRAIGDRRLLDASIRYADYLYSVFGPNGRPGAPGHPEIEMALVELYRETGQRRYLDLAGTFLQRSDLASLQVIEGHSVRAGYHLAGGVDYVLETGDEGMMAACHRLWNSMVTTKMYITGGVGGRYVGESYGMPFELPLERAYAETCAAISNLFWSWRMLAHDGAAAYADLFEHTLYNGFLSGVSLQGDEYFYVNPLADSGHGEGDPWYPHMRRAPRQRQPWHDCTCCPPNVQRVLASLPSYLFSTSDEGLWVHLFDACKLEHTLADGTALRVDIATNYPWDSDVHLRIWPEAPAEFTLFLRVPAWCTEAQAHVCNKGLITDLQPGTYLALRRTWEPGDTMDLHLPMPVRAIEADPRVVEARGSVALQRGPLIYCLEGADNSQVGDVRDARIALGPKPQSFAVEHRHQPRLLGGVSTLHMRGWTPENPEAQGPLYRPWGLHPPLRLREVELTAIPYYAWCNRGANSMTVFIQTR